MAASTRYAREAVSRLAAFRRRRWPDELKRGPSEGRAWWWALGFRACWRRATRITPGRTVVAVLVLSMAIVAGCGDNDTKPTVPHPPPPYLEASSAENVLKNLRIAYEKRDLEQYAKLFADEFSFVFRLEDATDPEDPTPDQWGFAEELEAARHLFADSTVDKIELIYEIGDTVNSHDEYPDTWRVDVTEVILQVHTRNPDGGVLIYLVDSGFARFHFQTDPGAPLPGGPTWSVFRWEDEPIQGKGMEWVDPLGHPGFGSLAIEQNSWGRIKHLFSP